MARLHDYYLKTVVPQLREQLKEQAHFIQRMKEVTSSHIQALEAQLAEVQ